MIARGRASPLRVILELICEIEAAEQALASTIDTPRPRGEPAHLPDPHEAAAIWQDVVDGRWLVVDQFDRGDLRCLVIRRSDRAAPAPRALSERERQIVARASLGHANKLIAYELGLCSSTVAAQLTSAARKLSISSPALLHAFAVLGGEPIADKTPSDASTPPPRREAPGVRVARFTHEGTDHAVIQLPLEPELPGSLTNAEKCVAKLAIKGLSNAAIARERQTSVRTIANQLRSIYAKLGVGSRRQLCSHFGSARARSAGHLGHG